MTSSSFLRLFTPLSVYALSVILLGILSLWVAQSVDAVITPLPASFAVITTFVALGTGLEIAKHRLGKRGGASGSIAFVIFIATALLFGLTWGAVVTGMSVTIAQITARRSPLKIAFNAAQCSMAIVLGTTAYVVMGGQIPAAGLWDNTMPYVGF